MRTLSAQSRITVRQKRKKMNKDIMKAIGLGKEVELVEQGKCPSCSQVIKEGDFKDDLSKKEFKISGLCQRCQDEIFS